jgi:hypothetical protein
MKSFILSLLLAPCLMLHAEPRHALIMGVWNYKDPTFPPLPEQGIRADLDGMNAKLTSLGFTVTVVRNPSLKQAKDAVDAFGRTISEQPGAALFYFTGHGSEYDGKNFLIPTGTAIVENADLDTEALAADRVLARLEKNSRFANIVFLDCCRNSLSKSSGTGMAAMEAKGTFIGYATATTKTSQATTKGSYYTNALVKYLGTPGLSITDMHTKVTREVKLQDSSQTPFQYSGLDDLFFFVPGTSPGGGASLMPPPIAPPAKPLESPFAQLNGHWKGVISYGDGYPSYLQTKPLRFDVEMKCDPTTGQFRGEVLEDYTGFGTTGPDRKMHGHIRGTVRDVGGTYQASFSKSYEYFDQEATTNTGVFDADAGMISGKWSFSNGAGGTFTLQRKDSEP